MHTKRRRKVLGMPPNAGKVTGCSSTMLEAARPGPCVGPIAGIPCSDSNHLTSYLKPLTITNLRSRPAVMRCLEIDPCRIAGGEVDVRGCYTAMAAAHMLCLDKADFARKAGMVDFVRRCQVRPQLPPRFPET